MNNTNWKIAEQSKQKLGEALLTVMEVYDYREITITQVAQEAGLSRKTFYRLFSDKDSVLSYIFESLFAECFSLIQIQKIEHYWDLVQLYFDFWEERKKLLSLLQKNSLLPRVIEYTYQHSMVVFEQLRSREVMDTVSDQLPYMLAYSIGGMHSMLLKWIEMGMNIPSSELIHQLRTGFMSPDI